MTVVSNHIRHILNNLGATFVKFCNKSGIFTIRNPFLNYYLSPH